MNNSTLDFNLSEFRALLRKTEDLVIDRFETLETSQAFCGLTPDEIAQWFDESLPEEGMDPAALLDRVKKQVMDTATLNVGPRMFAYVNAGGTQVSVLAELIAATINQNVGKWHLAPVISEMEKRVVQWGAEFIGYDKAAAGVLVSGGSAANLTGLTVARNIHFAKQGLRQKGLFGMSPFTVYGSVETHGCVDKSLELLGVGTDHYRKIPVQDDFTIDMEALKAQVEADLAEGYHPFCIVGNAGTVNTGAIDPLNKLADVAQHYGMWFHVDGAYGGLAAASPSVKHYYQGMERADSVAIDFHKWLYQPFEAGCVLVKDWDTLKRSFYKQASYLSTDLADDGRMDFNDHHFQLSRNARALKIWMSLKAYGRQRIVEMIDKDIALTTYLKEQLLQTGFEICNHPQLGVVCFRLVKPGLQEVAIDDLNKRIIPALEADGRVFITGTQLHNRPVIRACLINHRLQQEHVDHLVKVIVEVGQQLTSHEVNTTYQEG